jgi:hypothetical protein
MLKNRLNRSYIGVVKDFQVMPSMILIKPIYRREAIMPTTYESVCSGIEAATQPWHSLGMRAACFAEIEPAFRYCVIRPGERALTI